MKMIKQYWALILGAVATFFAIIIALVKKQDNDQVDKLDQQIDDNDQQIDDNDQQIDVLTGKIEVIEDQREEIKNTISEQEQVIEQTQEAKEEIKPETPKTVSAAKQNILDKTSKKSRGRNKKS